MERIRTETNGPAATQWLLIDCAHQGEVRLAHVVPEPRPVIDKIYHYDTTIPTFTDVLLRFEKDSGVSLRTLDPAIAVAGVPREQSTIIERSRWVISRPGLVSLFGRPVTILNEVAARAWALRGSLENMTAVRGARLPDLRQPGRYAFLTYEEGVGTAIIDIDARGDWTVLDGEGGQLDFAPANDAERGLAQKIVVQRGALVTWEQALMARRGDVGRDHADVASIERSDFFAALFGRFISNFIYGAGAWNGAFVTGNLIPRLDRHQPAFERGLTLQRPYHRLLANTGCWRIAQQEAVLNGCVAMMASRRAAGADAPAVQA